MGPVGLIGPDGTSLASSFATSVRAVFDVFLITTSAPAGAAITGRANDSPTSSQLIWGGDTGLSSPSSTITMRCVRLTGRSGASGFSTRSRKPLVASAGRSGDAGSSTLPINVPADAPAVDETTTSQARQARIKRMFPV